MTDPAHPERDVDIQIVDGRDMAFYLLIHKDGTSDMRATAPPRQVIVWLEQILEAIKTGEIGPETSPGEIELG